MPTGFLKTASGHIIVHPIKGNAGDANGKASLDAQVFVPDLLTAFSLSADEVLTAIGAGNAVCVDRPFVQHSGAEPGEQPGYLVTFRFQGTNGTAPPETALESATYSLKKTMREVPITEHPHFEALKTKYGWDDDKEGFTPLKPDGSRSPLYKVESFRVFSVTFTRRLVINSGIYNVFERMGYIWDPATDGEIPGLAILGQATPEGQVWFQHGSDIDQHGAAGALTLVEEYELSGPGTDKQALKDIYDFSTAPS